MLKKFLVFTLLLGALDCFACWRIKGNVAVDGETWKIDQKIDHDKEYGFPLGAFILKLTVTKGKGKIHRLAYKLEEKKGLKLELVTSGKDDVVAGKEKQIFARGEEGQPNSIMTFAITDI